MSESPSEIKTRILKLDVQLRDVGDAPTRAPEMLDATNALRLCEHLMETDLIKSKLIQEYGQYSAGLESLIKEALQIQKDLNAFLQKKPKRPLKKPQRKTPVKRKITKRKPILRKTVRKKLKRKPLKRKALRKPKTYSKRKPKKTTRKKPTTKRRSSKR